MPSFRISVFEKVLARYSTLDGTIQGTPAYMPPEQARGEVSEVDEQSDIYSLGAILYEAMAGAPPLFGSGGLTATSATARPVPGSVELRDRLNPVRRNGPIN